MTTVAILGAGPLGRRLALAAARAGFRVFLEDVMPNNLHHAQEYIRQQRIPDTIHYVSTIEDAVREADLAIDCVPDELESKLEILWLLDRMAPPHTVFATPTMRLSIADLASCTYRPERCVAIVAEAASLPSADGSEIHLHTTPHTAQESISLLDSFWRAIGHAPVFLRQ